MKFATFLKINLLILSMLVGCSTKPNNKYAIEVPNQKYQPQQPSPKQPSLNNDYDYSEDEEVEELGNTSLSGGSTSTSNASSTTASTVTVVDNSSEIQALYDLITSYFTLSTEAEDEEAEEVEAVAEEVVVEEVAAPTTSTVTMINVYHQQRASWYSDHLYTLSTDERSGYMLSSDEPAFQLWKSSEDAKTSGCTSGVKKVYQCLQQTTYHYSHSTGAWSVYNISGYADTQHYLTTAACSSTDTAEELSDLDEEADDGFLGYSCSKKDTDSFYKLKSWGSMVYFYWFGARRPGLAYILNNYFIQVNKEDTDDTYEYEYDADFTIPSGFGYQGSLGYAPVDL